MTTSKALLHLTKMSQQESLYADEDPMSSIERRLDEIRMMTKPRRDTRYVLDRVTSEQRQVIKKIDDIPMQKFLKERRKNRRGRARFRYVARTVLLLLKAFSWRKKYFVDQADRSEMQRRLQREIDKHGPSHHLKSSLGEDLQRCLIMQPRYRDTKMIKRILWLLRATRAFKHLFPAEMENEVARHLGYEKYEDGRIIALQGRTPSRFYYVISGRISLLRQFQITTGQVTKFMGYLSKGQTTDPEEMEKQWLREDSLVAKGNVEVLIIDREAFDFLQHTHDGPPVDFLRSLDLFEEFPIDKFAQHHDAIEYRYYGQGKVIVKDSNRTSWLHVIKSGQVKVVRQQSVIDSQTSNEGRFLAQSADDLGSGRSFSHAKAMMGLLHKQRKNKSTNSLNLPQISLTTDYMVANQLGHTIDAEVAIVNENPAGVSNDSTGNANDILSKPLIYRNKRTKLKETVSNAKLLPSQTDQRLKSPRGFLQPTEERSVCASDENDDMQSGTRGSVVGLALPPILNIPMKDVADDFNPHPLWLTREQTKHSSALDEQDMHPKELPQRRAYVQLDVLNPGDVFGLDHMQPALASEARGVSLLSDGAEVIRISKRFFLQHAANNTILKIDTLYKEYMTEDETKELLYSRETWKQYREALWQRLTDKIPVPKPIGTAVVSPR